MLQQMSDISLTTENYGFKLENYEASLIFIDLVPSDYRFFRSLQNYLNGKRFRTYEVHNMLQEYFSSKPQKFYLDDTQKLVGR